MGSEPRMRPGNNPLDRITRYRSECPTRSRADCRLYEVIRFDRLSPTVHLQVVISGRMYTSKGPMLQRARTRPRTGPAGGARTESGVSSYYFARIICLFRSQPAHIRRASIARSIAAAEGGRTMCRDSSPVTRGELFGASGRSFGTTRPAGSKFRFADHPLPIVELPLRG
jgi:hypothetical protein